MRALLESAYAKAGGSRKKTSIAKFALSSLGCNSDHAAALTDFKEQIREATHLQHALDARLRQEPAIRRVAPALPFSGVPVPPDSPEFEWTALAEIRNAQEENLRSAPESALPDDGGTLRVKGAA